MIPQSRKVGIEKLIGLKAGTEGKPLPPDYLSSSSRRGCPGLAAKHISGQQDTNGITVHRIRLPVREFPVEVTHWHITVI
jgi:hypothetical protein